MMNRTEVVKTLSILALASLVAFWLSHKHWLLYLSLFLLIIGILELKLAILIAEYWMKFAEIVGSFNSKWILSVVFYCFTTPLGIIYRLFNREAVDYFKKKNRDSFFKDTHLKSGKNNFEKMW